MAQVDYSHCLDVTDTSRLVVGTSLQTRYINPMLVQYWSNVYDAGPTLDHHWVGVSFCWDVSCFCLEMDGASILKKKHVKYRPHSILTASTRGRDNTQIHSDYSQHNLITAAVLLFNSNGISLFILYISIMYEHMNMIT